MRYRQRITLPLSQRYPDPGYARRERRTRQPRRRPYP